MGPVSRLIVWVCLAGAAEAGDIRGTVVIEKKLTRRTVTASAGAYQRGVGVDPGPPPAADPLAFERSHVAIYLEGPPTAASGGANQIAASIAQTHRQFEPDLVVSPQARRFPSLISTPFSTTYFRCRSPNRSTWATIRKGKRGW